MKKMIDATMDTTERITVSVARNMIETQTTRTFGDFAEECGYRIPDIYSRDILHRERTVKLSKVLSFIASETTDDEYDRPRS